MFWKGFGAKNIICLGLRSRFIGKIWVGKGLQAPFSPFSALHNRRGRRRASNLLSPPKRKKKNRKIHPKTLTNGRSFGTISTKHPSFGFI